jgi:UDP-2,3-diacylglucosamine hydrolase
LSILKTNKLLTLPGDSTYFLSDFHLGTPNRQASLEREKRVVAFLDSIQDRADQIFIAGDLFDFWFEYRKVVPKGFVRILGKLAEITDAGIPVHFFVGNHDMWMRNYFQEELNIPVYFAPQTFTINGKKILVGHGDGLGPGDHGYKFIKKVFRSPVSKFMFGILPPYMGMGVAHYFSKKSRVATGSSDAVFLGEDKEWLIAYCKEMLKKEHFDYFIFGHRHLPIDFRLTENSRYINLGDWIAYNSYAVMTGTEIELKYHTPHL